MEAPQVGRAIDMPPAITPDAPVAGLLFSGARRAQRRLDM
jgi:hypothetical protein